MIKNYIFDFGNVIAQFYPEKLSAPYIPDEKMRKTISEIVFDRIYWDRLDDGTITDDEVKEALSERLPNEMCDAGIKIYDNWVKNLVPVDKILELVYDIHKTDKKLYLLSNISIGFANTYCDVDWIRKTLSLFDGLVFSGVVGMVKPDRKIYEYILDKFNLNPEETLFIDDSEKNINGAKSVGIQCYLFDGDVDKLRRKLYEK